MSRILLKHSLALLLGSSLAALATTAPARAAVEASANYDLPAQPLGATLRAVALTSGLDILAPAPLIGNRQSPALKGRYTAAQAVRIVIAGSGLRARSDGATLVIEKDAAVSSGADPVASAGDEVLITGSRIRGGESASTLITVSSADIENQGKSSLASVVHAIPQSYGGGQNPGLGFNVPAGSGSDVGGASSINLRGLGSDATLTLLDGRRLAFTAARQSIDVSSIPLAAVDRLEIVADGASALYGSDAVAGVANIILKRKADGLEVGANLSNTTDGGDFEQRYWATGGASWAGGSVVASYDHGSNTPIVGAERSYAANKPGLTLYPALRHDSVLVTGQQAISSNLSLDLDTLYNIRWEHQTTPTSPTGDLNIGRAVTTSRDQSWAIAPSLTLKLPADWRLTLAGDIGREHVASKQITCALAVCGAPSFNLYVNSEKSAELSGDGRLLALPAGDAKIAVGVGYRDIGFERSSPDGTATNTNHNQDSYFAFSELVLPLLGTAQAIPFVDRLTATAAVRYERYPGLESVATPKLGLIWSPTSDFDLKGSWGQSFKAPTQYQQYVPRAGVIYPSTSLGGHGFPSGTGILYYQGGNPVLKPERATTWSTTLSLHPRRLGGASLEVSYFKVAYRDRIVAPIAFLSQALSNPIYAAQITRNPGAAEQGAIIASLAQLFNITGLPYNPANIVAIVDNSNVNAGRQTAQGIDILAKDRIALAGGHSLNLTADATYLKSSQQIGASQAVTQLAGQIFSPPHWRGQGIAAWTADPVTLAAAINYTGGVLDARSLQPAKVSGMTTLDLTARLRPAALPGVLHGIELSLSVSNVFDNKPSVIAAPAITDTPYDSTNYAPFGRSISVGISKRF